MPKAARTKPVSATQVRAYAGKTQEYADAAASELKAERYIAASGWRFTPPSMPPTQSAGPVTANVPLGKPAINRWRYFDRQAMTVPRSRRSYAVFFRSRPSPSTSPMTSLRE